MLARWWSFAVWAGVAGSAVFWGLRLFVNAPAAPASVAVAQAAPALRGDLTRLLGVDPPPPPPPAADVEPPADARFRLVGVVSPRGGAREGVALIAVDGQPPKAYRVGAAVTEGMVLHSVSQRGARLGPRDSAASAGSMSLELAPLPPPATGVLPPTAGGPANLALPRPTSPGLPGFRPQDGPGQAMGPQTPARLNPGNDLTR